MRVYIIYHLVPIICLIEVYLCYISPFSLFVSFTLFFIFHTVLSIITPFWGFCHLIYYSFAYTQRPTSTSRNRGGARFLDKGVGITEVILFRPPQVQIGPKFC